jgi:DNA repair exonuclease SbcCD ATPase subunit
MINNININGFQTHTNTKITFSPGLNVIVGSSDRGKSAILRSLLWLFKNKFGGESVRNWGLKKEDLIFVSAAVDGHTIIKNRKNGKNWYVIDGTKFEALKTDVPQELLNIINLSEFNIQTQHGSYCLIDDSPGEVTRKINELAQLDVIDRLFHNLNIRIRTTGEDIEEEEGRIKEYERRISNFDYLGEVETIISDLDKKMLVLKRIETECGGLEKVLGTVSDLEVSIANGDKILVYESLVKETIKQTETYETVQKEIDSLSQFVGDIGMFGVDLEANEQWLAVIEPFTALNSLITRYESEEKTIKDMSFLIKAVVDTEFNEKKQVLKLNTKQNTLEKLLKENKICPFCHQALTENIIRRITGE